jgi:hypothetical protein
MEGRRHRATAYGAASLTTPGAAAENSHVDAPKLEKNSTENSVSAPPKLEFCVGETRVLGVGKLEFWVWGNSSFGVSLAWGSQRRPGFHAGFFAFKARTVGFRARAKTFVRYGTVNKRDALDPSPAHVAPMPHKPHPTARNDAMHPMPACAAVDCRVHAARWRMI